MNPLSELLQVSKQKINEAVEIFDKERSNFRTAKNLDDKKEAHLCFITGIELQCDLRKQLKDNAGFLISITLKIKGLISEATIMKNQITEATIMENQITEEKVQAEFDCQYSETCLDIAESNKDNITENKEELNNFETNTKSEVEDQFYSLVNSICDSQLNN